MAALKLTDVRRALDGVLPSAIATCSAEGIPNITHLSQVTYVDDRHVALSRQFFNKTTRNILENPYATVFLRDPVSMIPVTLELRHVRAETAGDLFDAMATRIEAIAAHTGMTGIFRLIAVDVFEVVAVEMPVTDVDFAHEGPTKDELWAPPFPAPAPFRPEIWALQRISGRVSQARSTRELFDVVLKTLEEDLGIRHARVLVPSCPDGDLVVRASNGFGEAALGRKIPKGHGLLGVVAREKRPLRLSRIDNELRYVRAVKQRVQQSGGEVAPELPLPGLPDSQSHLILPLVARDELVGVLAIEDPNAGALDAWHEAFLEIVGNQVAVALERLLEDEDEVPPDRGGAAEPDLEARHARPVRRFLFYKQDECVFLDGEYLVRGVPAKILWKVLSEHRGEGRREFTNRELRMDNRLGLPELKDNLEARLTLLRKRLGEKCPEVSLPSQARGRFSVDLSCEVELVERENA